MYFSGTTDNEGIKKTKGANKNVAESIQHKEYVGVLFSKGLVRHKMKTIQSTLHRVGTYDVCKIYFSCFDDEHYSQMMMVLLV